MSGCLIDTQTLLWWRAGSPPVGPRARAALRHADAELFLSVASIWEICLKRALGKLQLGVGTAQFVESTLQSGVRLLDLRPAHLYQVEALPWHHRDPFDRLLVAQAIVEDLALVGADRNFRRYDVRVIW